MQSISREQQLATKDNEVITLIKEWKKEANNPRNDGWVTKHYQTKLKEVQKYLDKALTKANVTDYEEVIELHKTYGGD